MQKKKRNLLGEDFWRMHLQNCQKSEMSIVEYCKQNNLRISAYYYWKSRLALLSSSKTAATPIKPQSIATFPFVQVKLDETSDCPKYGNSGNSALSDRGNELELTTPRGYRFKISPDTNLGLLSVVLSTLEMQQC